jgi:NitT/TauT family transport system permease protein
MSEGRRDPSLRGAKRRSNPESGRDSGLLRSARNDGLSRILEIALPVVIFCGALALWEAIVRIEQIPPYILPAPSVIGATLVKDWPILSSSLWVTLTITFEALLAATIGGVGLAVLLAQSKWIERAFLPFAIVLQVTPVIAIAPLLLVWLEPSTAVLVCAFLVAFFPVLANTALGLASTDHNLVDLFDIYRAPWWKQLLLLRIPSALPYFFSGLRIAGGLALIGAIVAELAAGAAGQGTGLAFRIVEAGFRLNIPRMFAALALISATGIAIFGFFTLLSNLALGRWHESAGRRER